MLEEINRPRPRRTLVAVTRLTDRERIVRLLDRDGGYDIVAETGDGRSAVRLSGQVDPEVVLLELDLPEVNAIDATAAIIHSVPEATVVVLVPRGGESGGDLAVRFGARGHVLLDCSAELLITAIESALPRSVTGHRAQPGGAAIAPPAWWDAMLADR